MGNSSSEHEMEDFYDSGLETQPSEDSEEKPIADPVVSLEDHRDSQAEHPTTSNRSQQGTSRGRKNSSSRGASHQRKKGAPDSNSVPKPRRSKRSPKPRRFLLNETVVGRGKDQLIESEFDDRGGMDQPGRIFFRDNEEKNRREDEENGKEIFQHYLEPNGWECVKKAKLNSSHVFRPIGDETNEFDSYEKICLQWKSDSAFRAFYRRKNGEDTDSDQSIIPFREKIFSPERIGKDYPPNHSSSIPSRSSNKKGHHRSLFYENDDDMNMDFEDDAGSAEIDGSSPSLRERLGHPTPGVPAAAGLVTDTHSQNIRAKAPGGTRTTSFYEVAPKPKRKRVHDASRKNRAEPKPITPPQPERHPIMAQSRPKKQDAKEQEESARRIEARSVPNHEKRPGKQSTTSKRDKKTARKSISRHRPKPRRPVVVPETPPTKQYTAEEEETKGLVVDDARKSMQNDDEANDRLPMWNVPKRPKKRAPSDIQQQQQQQLNYNNSKKKKKRKEGRRKESRNHSPIARSSPPPPHQQEQQPDPQHPPTARLPTRQQQPDPSSQHDPVVSAPESLTNTSNKTTEANHGDHDHDNHSPLSSSSSSVADDARSWSTEQQAQLNAADFELTMLKKQLEIAKAKQELAKLLQEEPK